ncbi:hypothetical protein [Tenacibaculum sp.]|uniref:hypothetical protein n=1 Tax=Tenacibaculum sp. TaxID=1906242 RepID=UPI003D0AB7ED
MIAKYSSNSQQKYDDFTIIILILTLINISLFCYKISFFLIIISIILSIFFGILAFNKLYRQAFKISFFEDKIEVKYDNIIKTETFSYSDILAYKYSAPYSSKTPHSNYLILKNYKFRFTPIARNEGFIVFCKWLKAKNESIKIEIVPSDNYLNHLYQEEFGFNYRKR